MNGEGGSLLGEGVSRRILPNVASNLAFMLVNFVMGLVLVPYYISELGVAAYAIIPVATSITSYITLISDSLTSTVSRYLTIDMGSDMTSAKRTFNTAVFGFTCIVVAAIPIIILISLLAPSIFDIATNTVLSVQVMFVCILSAVLISIWSNNFITVMYSKNRIDLMNTVKIVQVLLQIALIILFFTFVSESVEYVGLAYLIAAVVYSVFGFLMARRVCPELRVSRRQFDRGRLGEMLSVGGWSLINSLGNLLFIQTSLLLVNVMMGAEAGGYFGVIVTLISAVSSLVDTLASIFAPIIYGLFADGKTEAMGRVSRMAVKVVGLVMSMPIAFLCVFSVPILTLWVGADYTSLTDVVWATMFVMIGIGAISPAYPLTMVYLKVKVPGIITFIFGLINVFLTVMVIRYTDLGLVGVGITWSVTMFVKNCIVNPWYIGRVSGMGTFDLHKSLAYGFVSYFGLLVFYYVLDMFLDVPVSWFWMILLGVVLLAIHVVLVYRVALNREEREVVNSCIPGPVRRVFERFS